MFKSVLVATDGSNVSEAAIQQAIDLAISMGATLRVVTVTPRMPVVAPFEATLGFSEKKHREGAAANARKILAHAEEMAKAAGIAIETHHVPDAKAADGVLETAKRFDADLIVIGSHHRRGLKRVLLGSQASHIASRAKVPVLVCPADAKDAE